MIYYLFSVAFTLTHSFSKSVSSQSHINQMGIFYGPCSTATAHHPISGNEEALQFLPEFCVLFFFFFFFYTLFAIHVAPFFPPRGRFRRSQQTTTQNPLRASLVQLLSKFQRSRIPLDSLDADWTKLDTLAIRHMWRIGLERIHLGAIPYHMVLNTVLSVQYSIISLIIRVLLDPQTLRSYAYPIL